VSTWECDGIITTTRWNNLPIFLTKKIGDDNRIYNLIMIIFAGILASVGCDFLKCQK
jgi:hypothetical protein